MLRLTVGVARANTATAAGESEVAEEYSAVGATAQLGATREGLELAETAREQRASRGVAAGRVGKALKAKILWADVARNKATRPGRAQTAERVRNSESGWCRRGKPTQRSPGFIRRKESNPMGDVVELPLRVSCQRPLRWPAGSSPQRKVATSRSQ
jgi:hypothetical protein